jgi:hypothetical protein
VLRDCFPIGAVLVGDPDPVLKPGVSGSHDLVIAVAVPVGDSKLLLTLGVSGARDPVITGAVLVGNLIAKGITISWFHCFFAGELTMSNSHEDV